MKTLLLFSLTLMLFATVSHGVQVKLNSIDNKNVFGILIGGPEMAYYGRADAVLAVSQQEYQAGPYIVTEVSIEMNGASTQLRIYHTESISVEEVEDRARGTADAATDGAAPSSDRRLPSQFYEAARRARMATEQARGGDRVIKDYPSTTHAKTIEYKVSSKSELQAFFRAFSDIFQGKPLSRSGSDGDEDDKVSARLGGTLFTISK